MTGLDAPRHGRSGVLLATAAAIAAMLFTISSCADDGPAPNTPATGSQVGTTTTPSVPPSSAATATTAAPNANAGGGGAGTGTTAP